MPGELQLNACGVARVAYVCSAHGIQNNGYGRPLAYGCDTFEDVNTG